MTGRRFIAARWDDFCEQRLGVNRRRIDRVLGLLEEFGPSSTVFDQKNKALAILRRVLMADEFLELHSEISDWHDKLWAEVLRCLAHSAEFCNLNPEKPDSSAFIQQ